MSTTTAKVEVLPAASTVEGGDVVIAQVEGEESVSKRATVGTGIYYDVATEGEVLKPDPDNPKLISNVAINDKLEEFEKGLQKVEWGPWGSVVDADLNDSTANAKTNNSALGNLGRPAGVVPTMNFYKSGDITSSTFAAAADIAFVYVSSDLSGLPSPLDPTNAIIRSGLLINTPTGDSTRRWLLPAAHPQLNDPNDAFYRGGGVWVAQAYDGRELLTSHAAAPDDNKWYPVSANAHDHPDDNDFNAEICITKRNGNKQKALRLSYSSSSPIGTTIHVAEREAATGNLLEEVIYSGGVDGLSSQLDDDTLVVRNLISGKSFANYDEIYLETSSSTSSATEEDEGSPVFSIRRWEQGKVICHVDCRGWYHIIQKNNNHSFIYTGNNSSRDALKLWAIVGRKYG